MFVFDFVDIQHNKTRQPIFTSIFIFVCIRTAELEGVDCFQIIIWSSKGSLTDSSLDFIVQEVTLDGFGVTSKVVTIFTAGCYLICGFENNCYAIVGVALTLLTLGPRSLIPITATMSGTLLYACRLSLEHIFIFSFYYLKTFDR